MNAPEIQIFTSVSLCYSEMDRQLCTLQHATKCHTGKGACLPVHLGPITANQNWNR